MLKYRVVFNTAINEEKMSRGRINDSAILILPGEAKKAPIKSSGGFRAVP
jgi:hypothetical protein